MSKYYNSLMTLEEMIAAAFYDYDSHSNRVNFELVEVIMTILARSIGVLHRKVRVNLPSSHTMHESSDIVISNLRIPPFSNIKISDVKLKTSRVVINVEPEYRSAEPQYQTEEPEYQSEEPQNQSEEPQYQSEDLAVCHYTSRGGDFKRAASGKGAPSSKKDARKIHKRPSREDRVLHRKNVKWKDAHERLEKILIVQTMPHGWKEKVSKIGKRSAIVPHCMVSKEKFKRLDKIVEELKIQSDSLLSKDLAFYNSFYKQTSMTHPMALVQLSARLEKIEKKSSEMIFLLKTVYRRAEMERREAMFTPSSHSSNAMYHTTYTNRTPARMYNYWIYYSKLSTIKNVGDNKKSNRKTRLVKRKGKANKSQTDQSQSLHELKPIYNTLVRMDTTKLEIPQEELEQLHSNLLTVQTKVILPEDHHLKPETSAQLPVASSKTVKHEETDLTTAQLERESSKVLKQEAEKLLSEQVQNDISKLFMAEDDSTKVSEENSKTSCSRSEEEREHTSISVSTSTWRILQYKMKKKVLPMAGILVRSERRSSAPPFEFIFNKIYDPYQLITEEDLQYASDDLTEELDAVADNVFKFILTKSTATTNFIVRIDPQLGRVLQTFDRVDSIEQCVIQYADLVNSYDEIISGMVIDIHEQLGEMQNNLYDSLIEKTEGLITRLKETNQRLGKHLRENLEAFNLDVLSIKDDMQNMHDNMTYATKCFKKIYSLLEEVGKAKANRTDVRKMLKSKLSLQQINQQASEEYFHSFVETHHNKIDSFIKKMKSNELEWRICLDDLGTSLDSKAEEDLLIEIKDKFNISYPILRDKLDFMISVCSNECGIPNRRKTQDKPCISCHTSPPKIKRRLDIIDTSKLKARESTQNSRQESKQGSKKPSKALCTINIDGVPSCMLKDIKKRKSNAATRSSTRSNLCGRREGDIPLYESLKENIIIHNRPTHKSKVSHKKSKDCNLLLPCIECNKVEIPIKKATTKPSAEPLQVKSSMLVWSRYAMSKSSFGSSTDD